MGIDTSGTGLLQNCTYVWLFFGAIIQNSTDSALTTMNTPATV